MTDRIARLSRLAIERAPAVAFFTGALAYMLVAASGATWMDSGELGAAGYHMGVAHPPGHPAYVMMARLASLIPIGEIGFRIALLSAVSMGAVLAAIVAIGRVITPRAGAAVAIVTLLFAVSPAVVFNAVRIEVYAPCVALIAWALHATLLFCRRPGHPRHALLAALGVGLAFAIHPLIAVAAGLPMGVSIIVAARGRLGVIVPACLALAALGVLAYAHVIVRATAATTPLLVWGDPSSLSAAFDLITGASYRDNFELGSLPGRMSAATGLAGEGTARGLVLAGFVGLLLASITRLRGAGLLLSVAFIVVVAAATQSRLNPDLRAYVLPALLALTIGAAILAAAISRLVASDGPPRFAFAVELTCVLVLAPFGFCGEAGADEPVAGDPDDLVRYFDESVGAMPPGPGVYFANGDPTYFAALYEQRVAGGRPDIAVANYELADTRWFLRDLKRWSPDIFVPFIDDGVPVKPQERLVIENLRRGHPVASNTPAFGDLRPANARPLGRGFALLLTASDGDGADVVPPLPFTGHVGHKLARHVALERAIYEARRGRLGAAARAAGFAPAWVESVDRPARADRPELFAELPASAAIFIHDASRDRLLLADLLWRAGERPIDPVGSRARVLLAAWQRLFGGTAGSWDEGQAILASQSLREDEATTRMLGAVGAGALAEKHLRAMLARHGELSGSLAMLASMLANRGSPGDLDEAQSLLERSLALDPDNDESHARLGVVRARRGDLDGARKAWQRALELNPRRTDVRAWLERKGADR